MFWQHFFDVSKAFDQVWHFKLIQKLKQINIDGHMLNFLVDFLKDRHIQVRIGNQYSTEKHLDMGLPQGAILSPTLFNIFMADLPKIFAKDTCLTQYADDICIWKKVTIKSCTPKRQLSYIRKDYQHELNKIDTYLTHNGMSLAFDKTKIMLFNAGPNTIPLPQLTIQNNPLQYTEKIKFLGITLTSKLNWAPHFNDILNKGRQGLNILKVIAAHKWGQNTAALRNVAMALVRSRLTYAQEVFFSAPNTLLSKLQSLDCKAFKIALGLPYHANNIGTYTEIDVPSLNIQRKASAAKFTLKSIALNTFCKPEVLIHADSDFAKRGAHIKSIQPIGSFVKDLLLKAPTKGEKIEVFNHFSICPTWLFSKAHFDINNTTINKSLPPQILKTTVLEYICKTYPKHLNIFTDGSRLDNGK